MSMYENDFYNAESFMAFENDSYLAHTYSDDDSYLMHYGVLGMHWGQRKDPEYYNRKDSKKIRRNIMGAVVAGSATVGMGVALRKNKNAYKAAKKTSELLKSASESTITTKNAKALKKAGYDTSQLTAKQLLSASSNEAKKANRYGRTARRYASGHNITAGVGIVSGIKAADYYSTRKKRQQNGSVSVY